MAEYLDGRWDKFFVENPYFGSTCLTDRELLSQNKVERRKFYPTCRRTVAFSVKPQRQSVFFAFRRGHGQGQQLPVVAPELGKGQIIPAPTGLDGGFH